MGPKQVSQNNPPFSPFSLFTLQWDAEDEVQVSEEMLDGSSSLLVLPSGEYQSSCMRANGVCREVWNSCSSYLHSVANLLISMSIV